MRWREIITTAIITLIVTIVAGVIVFYLTREPKPASGVEKLIYSLERAATFESNNTNVSFMKLIVKNNGTAAAHNVNIIADFLDSAEIQRKNITSSAAPITLFTDNSTEKQINLKVPHLVPDESLSVSLLLAGARTDLQPQLGVRSDGTLGKQVKDVEAKEDSRGERSVGPIAIMLILLGALVLQGLLLLFLRQRLLEWIGSRRYRYSPLNNCGFIYLQQGLVDEAEPLLAQATFKEGPNALTMANHGLALGLKGNVEGAKARFEAANWLAEGNHDKAVIAYNRGLLECFYGRTSEAKTWMKEAVRLSEKDIRRYARLNIYLREAAAQDSDFSEILDLRA